MGQIYVGLLCTFLPLIWLGQVNPDPRLVKSVPLNRNPSNIQFFNASIYIAGNGKLYQLNENLEIEKDIDTCSDTIKCTNVNKVLLVDKKNQQLITCGSGNNGICEARHLNKISDFIDKTSEPIVSVNPKRPAIGMVIKNKSEMIIGVTYGLDFEAKGGLDTFYAYPISTRSLVSHKIFSPVETESKEEKVLRLKIKKNDRDPKDALSNFLLYYKAMFHHGGFSYIFTNQKNFVGDLKNVTKMVRICQNDTEYRSYTDIVLNCAKDGKLYNLLQDAALVHLYGSSDKLFVGTFTAAENPEDAFGNSAICVEKLSELDKKIVETKKAAVTTNSRISEDKLYLTKPKPINSTYDPKYSKCDNVITNYAYVIGEEPVNMTALFTQNDSEDHITKVTGQMVSDSETSVVMAGTYNGHVIKLNVVWNNSYTLEKYEKQTVETGSPVLDIHIDGEEFYVMTGKKLWKYTNTDCSQYKTCTEVMEGRNPHCGWCAYVGRSSRKEKCEFGDWFSSLSSCMKITPTVLGQPADGQKKSVSFQVRPKLFTQQGLVYDCKWTIGTSETRTSAVITSKGVNCTSPSVNVHSEATVDLFVNRSTDTPSSLKLASSQYLFFKCSHYKKCGECVSTPGNICGWCTDTVSCSNTCPIKNQTRCPQLDYSPDNYIPADISTSIKLNGSSLIESTVYKCEVQGVVATAKLIDQELTCDLKLPATGTKQEYRVVVTYGPDGSNQRAELDDNFNSKVTVYRCEKLGKDCSHCQGLNTTRYTCGWCNNNNRCGYKNSSCTSATQCPNPTISKVIPRDGPTKGGTQVTISGKNLGTEIKESGNITIGGFPCTKSNIKEDFDVETGKDFMKEVPGQIVCTTNENNNASLTGEPLRIKIFVNGLPSDSPVYFIYQLPAITKVTPSFGPKAGGTKVTFSGFHLGVGNRLDVSVKARDTYFDDCKVDPYINPEFNSTGIDFKIKCKIPSGLISNITQFSLYVDNPSSSYDAIANFSLYNNPIIEVISPKKQIESGGINVTIEGKDMNHANEARMVAKKHRKQQSSVCHIESSARTLCRGPKAPVNLFSQLSKVERRKKRDADPDSESIDVEVFFDGYMKMFQFEYYPDPIINKFNLDEAEPFSPESSSLTITGKYLTLVAEKKDVQVTVGVEVCSVFKLTDTSIQCVPPKEQPQPRRSNSPYPEVNVKIGNVEVEVGYLHYKKGLEIYIIVIIVIVCLVVIVFVALGVFVIVKYRKQTQQKRLLQQKLADTELEIRRVAREEFLDMHTTMSSVNKNLVEQGFPYHSYQQFASHVMFASDYLLVDPVMSDDMRSRSKSGMEALEQLVYNKFFLISVISTMERQKKLFIREKANLAGNLCAILMGKMDFLNEVLGVLLANHVQDAVGKKQHKVLFRRSESITENLLSNWLSLCLYPHIKVNSGSPLYLLYMATQKTMESGPIDAITMDAKYTLSEEKLLKKWCSTDQGATDIRFEAKALNLRVVVDNGEQIYDCRALDCDTITQVKDKCLNQIYVNYPASQLSVDASELNLEWHAGHSGSLSVQDEDTTSKREGAWLRLNTLAHYNVKDGSNMALIDPHCADLQQQEDYVNLAQINLEANTSCSGSIDSSEPLTSQSEEPGPLQRWHLVKPDSEGAMPERSALEDLYLNRLFTTKQSILEYMCHLFDIILDSSKCPPPIKYLYDTLESLGEKYKIDSDAVHAWKSHSYPIRVWGSLMKQPSKLFDINVPLYVDSSLFVIAQVFIESFSLNTQKFTKDTAAQKLIFHNEMNQYREKAKNFYAEIKNQEQSSGELRRYLDEVNSLQQSQKQQGFNKTSSLFKFYTQLKPYLDDIIDDLSESKEAGSLQLHEKLQHVVQIMEEDIV